jgi:hypothetical protein
LFKRSANVRTLSVKFEETPLKICDLLAGRVVH